MLKYLGIFVIFVLCLFALMYILGGEVVERIGCCEESIPETDASETDASETDEPASKRIKS